MRSKETKRSNPRLWEKVKKEILKSPKGGAPNKWSARKAQMAVTEYKKRGGKYSGKKSPKNSLVKWTREKWGYIGGTPKRQGRYLPEVVRRSLTAKERSTENRLKGRKYGKRVKYSDSVLKKMRKYKII